MAATTIKVPSELRDRLNAEARRQGATVAQVIETLLAERNRRERFRQLRENMSTLSPSQLHDYLTDVNSWDPTLLDGLGPDDDNER